jgi:hypothetical protein
MARGMEESGLSSLHKLYTYYSLAESVAIDAKTTVYCSPGISMARGNEAEAKTKIGQTYYLAKKPEG